MIVAKDLTLLRGGRPLFEYASFAIHPGWRVGLTGSNGCGKSSLFELLRARLPVDAGSLERPPQWVVAHMAQEVSALPQPAIEFVLDGDSEWRVLDEQINAAQDESTALDGNALANLYIRYDAIQGYTARSRAAQLLAGLGFSEADQQRHVAQFSGGWRMRLSLAQALMCRSDLLLLDEPTNHLDLDAILWLEDWLCAYQGTLLVVSHDRDFLDAVVGHIIHIEQCVLTHYRGNYSQFERMRSERLAQQTQMYEKQQTQVAHLTAFVERFRAKASKAKQAQSRLKALERMTLTAPSMVDSSLDIRFAVPEKMGSPLLRLDEADLGYANAPILRQVDIALAPGSRLGLLGPNGAGKSTLIKSLVGELTLLSGQLSSSEHLRLGYFAQHQIDHLDAKASALLMMQRLSPKVDELTLRNFLGGFGFRGDRVTCAVEPFSGGEKARLALALIVWQKPNVLLLDEPTNHLDLDLRHALLVALQAFQGAVVLVSHDRHLVSATCDELLLVVDGEVRPFQGDIDAYASWLREWRANLPKQASAVQTVVVPVVSEPVKASAKPVVRSADVRALQQKVVKAELLMQREQQALQVITEQLSRPDLYEPEQQQQLNDLLAQQKQAQQTLDAAEQSWLATADALEALLA
ncbi:MAG: ATP-binding cassette domain-containing protein [Moraxellaceae bacterium]|nr:ATP-binding cassette domain-containing protein [Moraxellaceae bacterium]